MTLTEFLLARIEEDEYWARRCEEFYPSKVEGWEVSDRGWLARIWADEIPSADGTVNVPLVASVEQRFHDTATGWLGDRLQHIARHDPARVLAECEAKRQIVEGYETYAASSGSDGRWTARVVLVSLRCLATVYADHNDYDEAWKP